MTIKEQKNNRVQRIIRAMQHAPTAVYMLDEHIIAEQAGLIDGLVAACNEAAKELRLLNLTDDGMQKLNTPAAIICSEIAAALAKAGGV